MEAVVDPANNKYKFPSSFEVWSCCGREKFYKFSNLINHIENQHLNYYEETKTNSKGSHFKYICQKCGNIFFEYNIAIQHFLKKHTFHKLRCRQCILEYHSFENFKNHTSYCNQCVQSKNSKPREIQFYPKSSDSDE